MKKLILSVAIFLSSQVFAQHIHVPMHEMQHGFILSSEDTHGSHLVATGHHSRQVEIDGQLQIEDLNEKKYYDEKKSLNKDGHVYYLFQAQKLDLPSVADGQTLDGHIIESKSGDYEPKNIIVKKARFLIKKVILNIENPFFKE